MLTVKTEEASQGRKEQGAEQLGWKHVSREGRKWASEGEGKRGYREREMALSTNEKAEF